jgi:hypothetical protein
MTTSVFPCLLHQDPGHFQLGRGTIWHRSLYSVSLIFVTRNDDGGFSYSEIVGNLVAAEISNAYHPAQARTVSNTMSVWARTSCGMRSPTWPRNSGPIFAEKFARARNNGTEESARGAPKLYVRAEDAAEFRIFS